MSEEQEKNNDGNDYFKKSKDWDEDISFRNKRDKRYGWILSFGLSILLALSIIANIYLSSNYKVMPYVVRVDNSTGLVDVVYGIKEGNGQTFGEAIDRSAVAEYVRYRERYIYAVRDYDRYKVALMSSPRIRADYESATNPRKNSQAPINLYKDKELTVKIKSISWIDKDKNTILIRYYSHVKGNKKKFHYVITLKFEYSKAEMSEEDRLINPLGFQVTIYRKDYEAEQ